MPYDPASIEPKWQRYWEENKTFKAVEDPAKEKFYCLDMFPYPSGAGLHVGHPEGYTASDIVCRFKRMRGYSVLHPMGWDAFGLPAEQYALQTGTHPRITTQKNIDTFRRQIKSLGFSYDWDREIDTTDPKYYKWTQWIFLQLYKRGLAYEQEAPVNWCPALKTVLANEEVINGLSERGNHPVIRKPMRQWMLKITQYADRLLEDLEGLDWPDSIKEMQRNWIGKSEGANVDFKVDGTGDTIRVFTTRPDTLFGATYMVLAPEHRLVETITAADQKEAVDRYIETAKSKSDLDRTDLAKEKTGVFTGAYAINPVNNEKIPIWVADYVLISYGTGAIMAVPAHDERDYEFAKSFDLPIIEVISGGDISQAAHTGDGVLVNSPLIDGLNVPEAKKKITAWLRDQKLGEAAVNYKLRDWLFSRQRYWGEPFPLYHLEDGTIRPLDKDELPLKLPETEVFEPGDDGQSPLVNVPGWVDFADEKTGKKARRDTNTMPQWAGSCWYYLRYIDALNNEAGWDAEKEKYWMPVDLYVGGAEHAVLHLLYSRFWHKVLYDEGHVSTKEPFQKLVNQGLILGENGEKMSKSLGNVINPDDVVGQHGADALRTYEMFMGPLERAKPWSTSGIDGISRFLKRIWRVINDENDQVLAPTEDEIPDDLNRLMHKTIKKVTHDIENLRFNTAISQLMIFTNAILDAGVRPRSVVETLVLLVSPFCPHLGEELWQRLGHDQTLAYEPWPEYDESLAKDDVVKLAIQVNGKVRDELELAVDAPEDEVKAAAFERPKIQKWLEGMEVKKFIYVPGRVINIAVGKKK